MAGVYIEERKVLFLILPQLDVDLAPSRVEELHFVRFMVQLFLLLACWCCPVLVEILSMHDAGVKVVNLRCLLVDQPG